MTGSIDPALVSRLSGEFTALGTRMGALGRDLEVLHRQVLAGAPAAGSSSGGATRVVGDVPPPGSPTAGGRDASTGPAAPVPAPPSAAHPTAPPTVPGTGSTPEGWSSSSVEPGASPSTGAVDAAMAPDSSEDGTASPYGWAEQGAVAPRDAAQRGVVPSSGRAEQGAVPPREAMGPGAVPPPGWGVPAAVPPVGPAGHWSVPPPGWAGPGAVPRRAPRAGSGAPPSGTAAAWMPKGAGAPGDPVPSAGGAGGRAIATGSGRGGRGIPPVRAGVIGDGTPWWQRDGVISRILAVAGVAVTLIGVVMLLVLAAQAGLFGPMPRVVAGAVFSAALVGAGVRVFGRAGGRVGGIALAATGIAGAYLDVVAVTAIYDWLHPVPGFAVAFAVAACGVALAVRWQSQPLAVLVVAGAALAAPFVTVQPVLLVFLIALQAACLPVHLQRDWPFLHVVRTSPAVVAITVFVAVEVISSQSGRGGALIAAAVAVAVIGSVGTLVVVRARPADLTASLALAAAATPLLIAVPALLERRTAVPAALAYAAVLLAVAFAYLLPRVRAAVRIPNHTAVVAAVAGALALLEACVAGTDSATLPIALFLVALGFLGVAGQQRSRVAVIIGAAFGVLGGLALLADASPETLASQHFAQQRLGTASALAAVAGLGVLALLVWSLRRIAGERRGEDEVVGVGASVAALYLVTVAAVSIGVAAGGRDGFVAGHSVATILWMGAATAALLYGLRKLATSGAVAKVALGSGLLLTGAALAKLFLFDLATLDGFVRVGAFLAVGVLLLLTGTRYARAFAEAGERASTAAPEDTAGGPTPRPGDEAVR
ncbi:DUF2339 domain-containing protein [Nocardia farcinica]|uniref:DUF2339 domain-containing protein n=1 Tax=Nocardia farcinica TaxID=37329 RepID=UPI002458A78F|nr:DUF2339 domain-containing protein [Nocardia farcinica]